MLVHERGLFAIFEKLRTKSGIYTQTDFKKLPDGTITKSEEKKATTELGELLLCFYCTSIWVGLVVAKFNPINALSYSAMAIVTEKITSEWKSR